MMRAGAVSGNEAVRPEPVEGPVWFDRLTTSGCVGFDRFRASGDGFTFTV